MTSIQIVSDLHLDKNRLSINAILEYIYNPKVPNIALLGNIGYSLSDKYANFIKAVAGKYRNVFLLTGNADFYSMQGPNCKTMKEIEKEIITICAPLKNVYYLRRNIVYLGKGNRVSLKPMAGAVKIMGTTLWSHIPKARQEEITRMSPDYQCIFTTRDNQLTSVETSLMFRDNAKWIIAELKKTSPKQKLVLLTHHAPTFNETLVPNQQGIIRYTHASQLDKLIRKPLTVWAFGHTLSDMDMTQNYVRLVNNPLRYSFDLKKTERAQFSIKL